MTLEEHLETTEEYIREMGGDKPGMTHGEYITYLMGFRDAIKKALEKKALEEAEDFVDDKRART